MMKAVVLFISLAFLCLVQCQDSDSYVAAFQNIPSGVLLKDRFRPNLAPVNPPPLTACPALPPAPEATNVNNLRPGNIKVVMAMGDSIIAGMSAKDTNLLSLKEYRGLAFCIGADAGVNTFPNILKQFAPTLIGVSTGIGKINDLKTNGLNGAVSGAINQDMLGQAQWLVKNMTGPNSGIDVQKDWKVLTIWIGSNNLCDVCNNQTKNNGASYEQNLMAALNYLYSNVPRLFVNLIAPMDISSLYNIQTGLCGIIHQQVCGCVGTGDVNKRNLVSATAKDYVALSYKIAESFNSRKNPEWAVVVQPFLTENKITDRNLLSAADCFHPSASAHAMASTALWNNMLSTAANKQLTWGTPTAQPICPTADSIFPTN